MFDIQVRDDIKDNRWRHVMISSLFPAIRQHPVLVRWAISIFGIAFCIKAILWNLFAFTVAVIVIQIAIQVFADIFHTQLGVKAMNKSVKNALMKFNTNRAFLWLCLVAIAIFYFRAWYNAEGVMASILLACVAVPSAVLIPCSLLSLVLGRE